jgi:hypothetical protein
MSNIPDFVLQIKEVERQLRSQMEATAEDWRDRKKEEYYQAYMEEYCNDIDTYITGKGNITGMGVNDLVVFCDRKLQEMERLSGISANVQFELAAIGQHNGCLNDYFDKDIDVEDMEMIKRRGGIVHDDQHVRDYWNDNENSVDYNGPRPGELNQDEIGEIYRENNR